MRNKIDISDEQLAIVKEILLNNLPANVIVWAFGSRATFQAKKYSDLDLALEAKNGVQISCKTLTMLENAFEYSVLPWKVDIVDIDSLDKAFREIVDNDKILLC